MTFVEEAIISGFIGEIIGRCTGISWFKIKEALKNKKNKYQNTESQIYNVVVNVLNQITCNKFENDQDKIYQAAEKLLMSYKDNRCDSIEVVRDGLQILDENVNNDKYMEYKKLLYQELSKDDYEELYRQIRLLQQNGESSKTSRIEKKISSLEDAIKAANEKLDSFKKDGEGASAVQEHDNKFQNNKKQKYIENWSSRLFLHIDDKDKPLTLADAFIIPDYDIYCTNKKIGISGNDTFEQTIERFISYDRTSTMLITGVPGIGKTSITAWIANKYKDDDRLIVLRFRDWDSEELENGIVRAICNTLKCYYSDLNDKIIILDGFDELKSLNIREELLNGLSGDILDWENIKLIITSRPAYIDSDYFQNVIKIKEFDISRIRIFYEKIKGYKLADIEKIESDLEVLGVPVILYMAIMSDVDISKNSTKPELYSRIFAEKGGIFDRFCVEGVGYDSGAQLIRDRKNINSYLKFLQEVAFKMFEKGELVLLKDEYEIPELKFQGYSISVLEFPIKHLFENRESNIEFIHKSIFEYFVSEYFFASILRAIQANVVSECLAGFLGNLFKSNNMSPEIIDFLKFRIINSDLNNKLYLINEAFQLMLVDGMTFYVDKKCKNVVRCELLTFANMLELLHMWEGKVNLINIDYLKFNVDIKLNLRNAELSKRYLRGVELKKADLQKANLRRTVLRRADLRETDLRGADMCYADLSGSDIRGADLEGSKVDGLILKGTIIDERQAEWLNKKVNLYDTKICISKTQEIMNYSKYCEEWKR